MNKRLIITLYIFLVSIISSAQVILKSSIGVICYDTINYIPTWTKYTLWPEMLAKNYGREDLAFKTDARLSKKHRVKSSEYTGSGYDRGHLIPAGDFTWSEEEMKKTFVMTNVAPQVPSLNRGPWRILEEYIRFEVINKDSAIVYTGTLGNIDDVGRIVVPEYFWKVVQWYSEGKIIKEEAWLYENSDKRQTMTSTKTSPKNLLRIVYGNKR